MLVTLGLASGNCIDRVFTTFRPTLMRNFLELLLYQLLFLIFLLHADVFTGFEIS